MVKDNKKIDVTIFGRSYTLMGSANPEYMLTVCKYVDSKMEEISTANPQFDPLKTATLAAVNITNELFQSREQSKDVERFFEEKSKSLINILDKTLEE